MCEHMCWSCTPVSNAISLFTCMEGSLRLLAPKYCAGVRFFYMFLRVLWHFSRRFVQFLKSFVQFSWTSSHWFYYQRGGGREDMIRVLAPKSLVCAFSLPSPPRSFHLPWIYCLTYFFALRTVRFSRQSAPYSAGSHTFERARFMR